MTDTQRIMLALRDIQQILRDDRGYAPPHDADFIDFDPSKKKWHPMTLINPRAKRFNQLSREEQASIEAAYPDWTSDQTESVLWEFC